MLGTKTDVIKKVDGDLIMLSFASFIIHTGSIALTFSTNGLKLLFILLFQRLNVYYLPTYTVQMSVYLETVAIILSFDKKAACVVDTCRWQDTQVILLWSPFGRNWFSFYFN